MICVAHEHIISYLFGVQQHAQEKTGVAQNSALVLNLQAYPRMRDPQQETSINDSWLVVVYSPANGMIFQRL